MNSSKEKLKNSQKSKPVGRLLSSRPCSKKIEKSPEAVNKTLDNGQGVETIQDKAQLVQKLNNSTQEVS